jgi:DNA segregation ATPase FtsK/SpoIIIE-like protein
MTVQSPDVAELIVDQAKVLAEHDGVPHGLTHLIAAAEAVVAAVRREMDRLIAEFAPHGAPALNAPAEPDLPREPAPPIVAVEPEPAPPETVDQRSADVSEPGGMAAAEVER